MAMSATAIRFDDGEKDWIQSYASVLGMSFSEFVRNAALDKVEEAADIANDDVIHRIAGAIVLHQRLVVRLDISRLLDLIEGGVPHEFGKGHAENARIGLDPVLLAIIEPDGSGIMAIVAPINVLHCSTFIIPVCPGASPKTYASGHSKIEPSMP